MNSHLYLRGLRWHATLPIASKRFLNRPVLEGLGPDCHRCGTTDFRKDEALFCNVNPATRSLNKRRMSTRGIECGQGVVGRLTLY